MDELAEREREKYRTIWDHDAYRKVSPGMFEVEEAWREMGVQPGMSLNDYGSGPCRATKWFQDQGVRAFGIDHAANACETAVLVYETTLWDMSKVPPADFGFCCDVMEHIPPEKVDSVLREIARLTHVAAWFRIATRADVMGPQLIGEPLHLTIKDSSWWEDMMREHWDSVEVVHSNGQDVILHCRH